MSNKLKSSLSLILCSVIWGSAFVAQSVGMDHIGPFTFQAVRCTLAVIALLIIISIGNWITKVPSKKRRSSKKLWKTGILCGIPLFLATSLQQIGLIDTDAGKSAFLTAMYIVIVPILGVFLKRKPSKWIPLSVVLGVIGLYCLSCIGVTSIQASDLLLLGCAFMFAVQITFIDLWAQDLDPLYLNLIQALVCAVLSAIVMLLKEQPTLSGILSCWLPLSYAGILSLGVAYALQIKGQQGLSSSTASLIMSLESVFAVLFGWILLGERLTDAEWIGCGLMFLAVILSQLPNQKHK